MFTQTTTIPTKFIRYKDQIVSADNIKSVEIERSFKEGDGGKLIFSYHNVGNVEMRFFEDQPLNDCWEDVQVMLGFDV
jgi:hypothetical protein